MEGIDSTGLLVPISIQSGHTPDPQRTTSGSAQRAVILRPELAVAYEEVCVQLGAEDGVLHVFGADGETHHLTVPLSRPLVEWRDASEPRPWMPEYGPGAFGDVGEQMQRMPKT